MADDITIDVSEWVRWAATLDRDTKRLIDKHMRNAMDGSLDWLLERITLKHMGQPFGKNPAHGVNFGTLRGSFSKEIHGSSYNMMGSAATTLLYGMPVELGRSAGKMPPVDAIKLWVVRKLGISGKEADKAAWAIAYSIGKKGTEGVHMVQKTYDDAVSGPEITRIWEYELEQFLRELAR
jgi:hypothetical protein